MTSKEKAKEYLNKKIRHKHVLIDQDEAAKYMVEFAEAYHEKKMEGEPQLYVHDIRNKLGSITSLIDLMTDPRLLAVKETPKVIEIKNSALENAKNSINYLAQREVFKSNSNPISK